MSLEQDIVATEGDQITGTIQGMIQARVGEFLQCRSRLQEMSRSPVLTISNKAGQLLLKQQDLEESLSPTVEKAQAGDVIGIAEAGVFYYSMTSQIEDVNGLWTEYKGLGSSAQASILPGIPNWILYMGGAFIFWRLTRRKK
jgi:hypothetical protein